MILIVIIKAHVVTYASDGLATKLKVQVDLLQLRMLIPNPDYYLYF